MYRVERSSTPISATAVYGWADAIQPYVKSTQLLQCPSEQTAPLPPDPPGGTYPNPAVKPGYCDYVYNVALGSQPGASGPATGSGASLAALEQSSLCMMAIDGRRNGTSSGSGTADNGLARMSTRGSGTPGFAGSSNFDTDLHLAGCNLLFTDGHVKWQKGRPGASDFFATVYSANTSFADSGSNFTMHPYDPPTGTVFQYSNSSYCKCKLLRAPRIVGRHSRSKFSP